MTLHSLIQTPLHEEHVQRGGRLVEYAGHRLPLRFEGVVREHEAVRTAVGLFDVSHMGRLRVAGSGALDVVNQFITNDLARIVDGQALYSCACAEDGGIVDDLIVYRTRPGEVMVVCNAANRSEVATRLAGLMSGDAEFADVTSETCLLAVQGPRAFELLARVGAPSSFRSELGKFRVAEVELLTRPCTVARTGYTGEDGVEVFCSAEHAPELWRQLLSRGQELGARPVGLAARDTLRLEACLPLYGNEIDRETNPFEARLGWTVRLDKPRFVGKEALARLQAQPLERKLVGFQMVGRGVARHGYALVDAAGSELGRCTSGAPSPTLGQSVGLGYVPPDHAGVGRSLIVDCRGRRVEARLVRTPFYRRPSETGVAVH